MGPRTFGSMDGAYDALEGDFKVPKIYPTKMALDPVPWSKGTHLETPVSHMVYDDIIYDVIIPQFFQKHVDLKTLEPRGALFFTMVSVSGTAGCE